MFVFVFVFVLGFVIGFVFVLGLGFVVVFVFGFVLGLGVRGSISVRVYARFNIAASADPLWSVRDRMGDIMERRRPYMCARTCVYSCAQCMVHVCVCLCLDAMTDDMIKRCHPLTKSKIRHQPRLVTTHKHTDTQT